MSAVQPGHAAPAGRRRARSAAPCVGGGAGAVRERKSDGPGAVGVGRGRVRPTPSSFNAILDALCGGNVLKNMGLNSALSRHK